MQCSLVKPENDRQKQSVADYVVAFYKENPEEVRTNSYEEIREAVHNLFSNDDHTYFLIQADENTAGLVHIMQTEAAVVEIILIYLLPEYRRQGLGKSAIQDVIDKLKDRGVKTIKTEVNNVNHPSQKFFKQLEFNKHSINYRKEV